MIPPIIPPAAVPSIGTVLPKAAPAAAPPIQPPAPAATPPALTIRFLLNCDHEMLFAKAARQKSGVEMTAVAIVDVITLLLSNLATWLVAAAPYTALPREACAKRSTAFFPAVVALTAFTPLLVATTPSAATRVRSTCAAITPVTSVVPPAAIALSIAPLIASSVLSPFHVHFAKLTANVTAKT